MLCETAIMDDPIFLKEGTVIKDALKILENKKIRAAPVISEDNIYLGMFGYIDVLSSLLPKSAQIEDGLDNLNFVVGGGLTLAEHLGSIISEPIENHMNKEFPVVYPDTPIFECIRLIVKNGGPIPVIEKDTKNLHGIISAKNAVFDVERILLEAERYGKFDDKDSVANS